jgi:hypothetical protein
MLSQSPRLLAAGGRLKFPAGTWHAGQVGEVRIAAGAKGQPQPIPVPQDRAKQLLGYDQHFQTQYTQNGTHRAQSGITLLRQGSVEILSIYLGLGGDLGGALLRLSYISKSNQKRILRIGEGGRKILRGEGAIIAQVGERICFVIYAASHAGWYAPCVSKQH